MPMQDQFWIKDIVLNLVGDFFPQKTQQTNKQNTEMTEKNRIIQLQQLILHMLKG